MALTAHSLAVRKAKRDSWIKFTKDEDNLKDATRLQKVLAYKPLNLVGFLRRPDGSCTTSARETLKILHETHFPGCSANDSRQRGLSIANLDPRPWADGSDWDLARLAITLSKTRWAIDNFSPYKSPGADGVYLVLLQKAPLWVTELLC